MSHEFHYSVDDPALHKYALETLASADYALAHAPSLALTEPHTVEAVTADWLNAVLGSGVAHAKLDELIVVDAHDGMTSRKKWRLHWNDAGKDAGLPSSIFVKAFPSTPYHRESIAILHLQDAEVNFYRVLCSENPELAPTAYYFKNYPGGRFMILLEDLTERGCRPYWQADDCSIAHARAVAVTQARFHAKYWESNRLVGDLAWVRPRTKRFGWSWLRNSFCDVRRNFLDKATEEEIPADAVALLRTWNKNANAVFDYWENKPHTVLHGDSHLGNTFSYPDGRAGYYDWQVMFSGHGLRDLSYFLMSALTNTDRIAHEKEIFELYLETLAEGGVRLERQEAWNDYCLFAFDRWDAVIKEVTKGSYGHGRKGQLRSLKTIAGCLLDNDVPGRLDYLIRHKLGNSGQVS